MVIFVSAPPLFADWLPHVGPGTPLAVAVAALVVWHGPRWPPGCRGAALLGAGYPAAMAWTLRWR